MRSKRKPRYGRICILVLSIALLATGACRTIGHLQTLIMGRPSVDIAPLSGLESLPPDIEEPICLDVSSGELYSPYVILIRLQDQRIAFETRSEERIYPASLTKIMAAIVAIENISDLQKPVVMPEKIFPDLYAAGASMAGFLPGEEVPAIDLLYGMILPSGADAAIGLALGVSDSESDFVKLMNEKANQLGMKDTHFTNVCGLHNTDHYSTVKDMASLLQYALKNDTFRQVFTSMRHSTAPTNLHPDGITFYSTMVREMDSLEFDGGTILGGKTGYTGKSGLCLASLADKNGTEYILVTAGAAGNHKTKPYHIIDALRVYGKYLKK